MGKGVSPIVGIVFIGACGCTRGKCVRSLGVGMPGHTNRHRLVNYFLCLNFFFLLFFSFFFFHCSIFLQFLFPKHQTDGV